MNPTYLFSIDLEDIRLLIKDGERYKDAIPETIERYLEFLRSKNIRCTFFVVGEVARRHPEVIKKLIEHGHEIGCHTDMHIPLDKQTKEEFHNDLKRNVESLSAVGGSDIIGFRAPIFSLTKDTAWAYEVLAELGFKYSSSVLPANNPLYGWKDFGPSIKKVGRIIEVPMTLSKGIGLKVPFGGGLYFRVIPKPILRYLFSLQKSMGQAIGGYMHPYDIDLKQERFMQPGINNNHFYNYLMYYGRASVFSKLEMILKMGFEIKTYKSYLNL